MCTYILFFFKQKTAYEMRISDWSSDVCSSDLQSHLDNIGFNLVGYGCTTCIGNSGPLAEPLSKAINENGLVAAAVISGNRNFEGRVSPAVRANFPASPPPVVAYALTGPVVEDFITTPIGMSQNGRGGFPKEQ